MKRLSTDRSLKEKFIGKGLLMEGLATVAAPAGAVATVPAIVTAPALPAKIGQFALGSREKIKLRMAIDGPSGSGKSFTALRLAFALGTRILVIDSEAGSASKYWGFAPDGVAWKFYAAPLKDFSPSKYATLIEEGGRAGFDCIIVDSLSHAWEGTDGALELVDKKGGNRFAAWKDVTPMHRRMVDAILQSPTNVIVTMRSKTDYIMETDTNGKQVPRKIGMAPIQRPGMEYEFDVYGSMDWSHIMTITKTRCSSIDGAIIHKPGPDFMGKVIEWMEDGEIAAPAAIAPRITDPQMAAVMEAIGKIGWTIERLQRELPKKYGCTQLHELTQANADDLLKFLDGQVKLAASRAATSIAKQVTVTPTTPPVSVPATTTAPVATPAAKPEPVDPVVAKQAAIEAFPNGRVTQEQLGEIVDLVNKLIAAGMPREKYKEALVKRGFNTANDMSHDQAAELIVALRKKLLSMQGDLNASAPAKN